MKETINILHLSTAEGWRGGERQIANLLLESRKRYPNHKMQVYCVAGKPFERFCQKHEIPVHSYTKRSSLSISSAKHLQQICKQEQIDFVHTHDSHGHSQAVASRLLFGNEAKIIVHRRVDFPNKGLLAGYKYNHPQIVAYIPISKEIQRILNQTVNPKNQDKVHLIYSSVNEEAIQKVERVNIRQRLQLPDNNILVGNTSALADHKDYPTFLQTAKLLLEHNSAYQFIIVGGGELEQELQQLTHDLGIAEHVHFVGFQANAVGFVKDFDVFLMTSKLEGLGTAVLEAFACEVPVVATQAGGIKESVLHNKTGLSAPVGHAEELAQHVNEIITNATLRESVKQGATAHLHQHFTLAEMTKKTNDLYQQLADL